MSVQTLRPVYWAGTPPTRCQVTDLPITDKFVDGRASREGWWAWWHPDAFAISGAGLGKGCGQLYEKQADGRWLKTKG